MKKKNRKTLFVLALVFVCAVVIGGCNDTVNPVVDAWWSGDDGEYPFTQETFVVSFDLGGGNYIDSINGDSPRASPQRVWAHARASVPGLVTKAGNYFTGWYDAQTGGDKWDFANNPVEEDITLFAQWDDDGHMVHFNINFPSEESAFAPETDLTYKPLSESIAAGALAAEPLQFGLKSDSGYVDKYVFTGWYDDPTAGVKWNFATMPVTKDITLFARWAEIKESIVVYTVTFDSKADINPPPEQYVMSGGLVIAPYVAYRSGYAFGGWYKDAACTEAEVWDFTAMTVTADMTLYAKWASVDAVDVLKDLDIVDFRYILFSGGQTAYNGPAAPDSSTSLDQDEKNNNDGEIAKIAEWLNKYPDYRVMIVGHAHPETQADKDNPQNAELMALSQGRADAVEGELKGKLATQYDLVKTPIIVRAEGGRRAMRNPMLSRRVEIIVFDIITEEITP